MFPRSRQWEYAYDSEISVSTYGIPGIFRHSFLKILAATSAYYRQAFGAQSVGRLELNVRKQSGLCNRLWTNGADRIYLTLARKKELEPPRISRVFNIYGLAHELGHIVLYRSLINIHELHRGWGEGWAVYVASFMAVPYLFSKYGPDLWPYPYDYLQTEGPKRLLSCFNSQPVKIISPVTHAVHSLYVFQQQLGGERNFQKYFRELFARPIRSDMFYKKVSMKIKRTI